VIVTTCSVTRYLWGKRGTHECSIIPSCYLDWYVLVPDKGWGAPVGPPPSSTLSASQSARQIMKFSRSTVDGQGALQGSCPPWGPRGTQLGLCIGDKHGLNMGMSYYRGLTRRQNWWGRVGCPVADPVIHMRPRNDG